MKKPVFVILIIIALSLSNGISAQENTKSSAAAAKVLFIDHGVPNGNDTLEVTNGLEISIIHPISDWANLAVPFKISVADIAGNVNKRTLIGLDAAVQFPFFRSVKRFNPYLFGGAGFVVENFDESNIQFPLGIGANIFLGGHSFINFQAEYRKATIEDRDNLQFGLGYLFHIVKKPSEKKPDDRDGDGVSDEMDKCPDEKGSLTAAGCPDRDGDGIADSNDNCPDEPGKVSASGCPDADEDGIADRFDSCPDVPGVPALKGCPDMDADGDGVPDDRDECPAEAGLRSTDGCPDTDGDGVADKYDLCPGETGKKYTSGCPDRDQDGIADKFDDCPDLAGPPERRGCPNIDSDKDGVPDASDECPNIAAPGSPSGCPDSDGDGVHDGVDKCPTAFGPTTNQGCPELNKEVKEILALATSNVQFETGKAELLPFSYPVLVQLVEIMNKYKDYHLKIAGHTDNVGDENKNLKLSQDRAKACFDYFVSKGISPERMIHEGFGESRPVAPNTTVEGRAINRRVEFDLYLK